MIFNELFTWIFDSFSTFKTETDVLNDVTELIIGFNVSELSEFDPPLQHVALCKYCRYLYIMVFLLDSYGCNSPQ